MDRTRLEFDIIGCTRCSLTHHLCNKQDKSLGTGKLLGWYGGKEGHFMFVGMNPSHNRFPMLEYAFGGKDFLMGTGVEFVNLLKEIGVLEYSYVTNLVKCSSLSNSIDQESFEACLDHFINEIKLVNPSIIITLGKSVTNFLKKSVQFCDFLEYNSIELKEVWHPNYVFSYNREAIESYKKKIKEVIIL